MAEMPVAAQRSSWSSSYITSPSTSNRSDPSQTVATVAQHKYMQPLLTAAPVVTSRDGDGGAVIYLYIQ